MEKVFMYLDDDIHMLRAGITTMQSKVNEALANGVVKESKAALTGYIQAMQSIQSDVENIVQSLDTLKKHNVYINFGDVEVGTEFVTAGAELHYIKIKEAGTKNALWLSNSGRYETAYFNYDTKVYQDS